MADYDPSYSIAVEELMPLNIFWLSLEREEKGTLYSVL